MEDESKDGSSSEPQVTEPMDTWTDVGSSLLGKRKIETTNVEDPGVDDEEEEEEEEEEEDSDDPNWDKDSFDGREYHSADDQDEFLIESLRKDTHSYRRTVIETKGFFDTLETDQPLYIWSGICTVPDMDDMMTQGLNKGLTVRQFLADMTCLCVEKYNKRKQKKVEFKRVMRANFNPGGSTKYYITFAARESDSPDAPLVEYQAKVAWSAGKTYPILCRPTSPLKFVEDDGEDQSKG